MFDLAFSIFFIGAERERRGRLGDSKSISGSSCPKGEEYTGTPSNYSPQKLNESKGEQEQWKRGKS